MVQLPSSATGHRTVKANKEGVGNLPHLNQGFKVNGFESTAAPPGSAEKIEVLRRRVELGQPLHHPLDVKALTRPDRQTTFRNRPNLTVIREAELRLQNRKLERATT